MRRIALALVVSVSPAALAYSPAHAQETQAAANQSQGQTIIVTARKREEEIQDVPASTTVITEEMQDLLSLDSAIDYVKQVPGALFVSAGPEYLSDFSLRGQGGGRNGFSESATGIYRNGLYVAGGGFGGRSFNRLDFFDLERVEVYRGPQGALYGRNAVGGAINVISQRPVPRFEGFVEAGYTDAERFTAEGVLNVPLGSTTGLRVGGFIVDQNGGDIEDAATGEEIDFQSFYGARAAIGTEIGDWDARIIGEYYESSTPSFTTLGRRLATNLPPGRNVDPGPFERNGSLFGRVDIDEWLGYFIAGGPIGDVRMDIVAGYRTRDASRDDDLDHFLGFEGLPNTSIVAEQFEDFERFGVEARLSSDSAGPLSWLVGADFQTFEDHVITANSGTSVVPNLQALATRRDESTEELSSWSIFGLLGYDFSPEWNLTVEARIQRDSKDFDFVRTGAAPLGPIVDSTSSTRFLPVASLSYEYTPDQQLYARVATGFRPGGFNLAASTPDTITYSPEDTVSFELGWKGFLPDIGLRFDVAAYYALTDDVQLVSAVSPTDTLTVLQNAEGSELYGLEAQVGGTSQVGDGRLLYNLGFATQQGSFDPGSQIVSNGQLIDLGGSRVNRTRDYVVNASLFYDAPLGGDVSLIFGGSVQAEGGGFENAAGNTATNQSRELDDYVTVDARVTLRGGDRWQVAVFGTNIFDETYVLQTVFQNEFYNTRRRFGVEARLTF